MKTPLERQRCSMNSPLAKNSKCSFSGCMSPVSVGIGSPVHRQAAADADGLSRHESRRGRCKEQNRVGNFGGLRQAAHRNRLDQGLTQLGILDTLVRSE